jgi:phage shock protein PspC (stress-responsive transcriptional regulator)
VPIAREPHGHPGGGVIAGISRAYGLDARLARIVVAVLTLPIPALILVYLAAWVVLPADQAHAATLRQLVTDRHRRPLLIMLGVALALSGIVSSVGNLFGGRDLGWALGLIIVGVMLWVVPDRAGRARDQGSWTPPVPPADQMQAFDRPDPMTRPMQLPARFSRPQRPVGALAIAGTTVALAVVRVGDSLGWWHVSVLATALVAIAVLCAATLASAIVNGRYARLVFVLPLVLAGVVLSVTRPTFSGGVGKRTIELTTDQATSGRLRLAIGEMDVDARPAAATSLIDLHAEVGVGRLHLVVPTGSVIIVRGRIGAGHLVIDGREAMSGVSLDQVVEDGGGSTSTAGQPIMLDLRVGAGEISIERLATGAGR